MSKKSIEELQKLLKGKRWKDVLIEDKNDKGTYISTKVLKHIKYCFKVGVFLGQPYVAVCANGQFIKLIPIDEYVDTPLTTKTVFESADQRMVVDDFIEASPFGSLLNKITEKKLSLKDKIL